MTSINYPDLHQVLADTEKVCTVAPNATTVACQGGKVQYIGRGCFLQIENDTTRRLPDFTLSTKHLSTLLDWLGNAFMANLAVQVDVKDSEFVVFMNAKTIKLPLATKDSTYEDVDEVVLKPLLVNQYVAGVQTRQWTDAVKSLESLHSLFESHIPYATVKIDSEKILISSEHRGVTADSAIPFYGEKSFPDWESSYLLAVLGIVFEETQVKQNTITLEYPTRTPSSTVKISFAENTKAQISPLMLEYQNGVTVIAAPLWV